MISKLFTTLFVVVLVAASCGDSSDGGIGDGNGSLGASSGSVNFCDLAQDFEDSDPFGEDVDLDSFGPELFDRIDDVFDDLVDAAPSEIKADAELMKTTFREFADVLEEYDYNLFDPDLAVAMEDLDIDGIDAASERITVYMESECGIVSDDSDSDDSAFGSTDDSEPDGAQGAADDLVGLEDEELAIAAIMQAFGIDRDTAECLSEELPELDFDDPDPALMTSPVCGTTLLEIITNAAANG